MIPDTQTLQRANEIIAQIESLQSELVALFGGTGAAAAPRRGRPSAAAKAAPAATKAPSAKKGERNMSEEGRARIAAAAKARWAKYRAAKKKEKAPKA